MYEAIIRVNNSKCTPIKLELVFCRDLARHLDWHHEAQVIIRFAGSPERWAGTIGMKAPDPYVWTYVTLVGDKGLVAGKDSRRRISDLLYDHHLERRDRVPVSIDDLTGDLVLDAKHHRVGNVSPSRPHNDERRDRRLSSNSPHVGDPDKAFPFGNRQEIDKLADAYWEQITRSEWDVERHAIPQIVEHARKRGYLEKDEFVILARWKSPRPTQSYLNNSATFVASQTARSLLPTANREDALAALDELDGVALRTATAILHWFRPEDTPILDQRVVAAIRFSSPSNWENIDLYREVADKIIREARRVGVDLRTMDRALWTWDRHNPR